MSKILWFMTREAAAMKMVNGESFPRGDFLVHDYDGDGKEIGPSDWALQVRRNGKPDHDLMGAAWAALHEGHRGKKYDGAHKADAIDALKALYKSQKLPLPGMAATVKEEWVPFAADARFLATQAAGKPEDDGWVWPVQVIQEGFAGGTLESGGRKILGAHYFTPEVVGQVAQAVNGTRFGRRHPVDDGDIMNPERVAGWFENGRVQGNAAHADLHLLTSEGALRDKLLAARQAGRLDLFGLSVFGLIGFKPGQKGGKDALLSTRLGKLITVDMVTEAGAGGGFLKVAAGASIQQALKDLESSTEEKSDGAAPTHQGGRKFGGAMKEKILKAIEALRKLDAGRADQLTTEFNSLSEEKHDEFFVTVNEALVAAVPSGKKTDHDDILARANEALATAQKIQSQNMVERKLTEAKLPKPAEALVREHLEGRILDDGAVDGEIKRVREAFASFASTGKVDGNSTIVVGRESQDKIQLAMDAMLGVREAVADANAHSFRGIKDAYMWVTGDRELTFQKGGFYRVSQAISTSDFPNILLNSLTKKLIQDYAAIGMGGLDKLVTTGRLDNFMTQDRVRMGYLGDLPTVAEIGSYTELTKPTDELISYAPSKRGGLLTISEETIRNDNLGKIAQFPSRLARAGRRTLKQFITDFFANNPNYDPDSVAWFNAAHNNLGSTAISSDELNAREVALLTQTEKDSGKPLGLPLEWIMVPPALKATAFQINNNNDGTNSWYGRFGVANNGQAPAGIIVNELLTDANDWYWGCYPAEAPIIEIGYLDGLEQPQILLANMATQGTQFTNDEIQYKVKFVFGGDILDYRSVGKNVVA